MDGTTTLVYTASLVVLLWTRGEWVGVGLPRAYCVKQEFNGRFWKMKELRNFPPGGSCT